MNTTGTIKDVFQLLKNDGKLYLILLASFLISIPSFINSSEFLPTSLVRALPIAFAWLVLTWMITDLKIIRRPGPYLLIFFLIFIENIYYSIFYNFYPEIYENQTIDINLLFVLTKIITTLLFILVIWYLSKPRDFARKKYEFIKNKKIIIVVFSTFFVCLPVIYYPIYLITGFHPLNLATNIDFLNWYNFIFGGIPFTIGMLLLSVIVTNIKTKTKFYIYSIIGFFLLFQYLPFRYYLNFSEWTSLTFDIYDFIINFTSWFFVFLGLLLVSKKNYLE